jgi:signal transduction histidine kinase
MKSPILTLLLLLYTTAIQAQKYPSKLDSLKKVLAHLPAEGQSFAGDTLRMRVLCEMGAIIIQMQKFKLLFYAAFMILVFCPLLIAQNPYSNNFIDSSKISLMRCIKHRDSECYIKNCINISDAFLYLGKNDSSLNYLKKVQVNELISNDIKFAYYYQFGRVHNTQSLYFSALQYAYKSLFYAEKLTGSLYKAKSYTLLANIHGLLNNNKEALFWHTKALSIYNSKNLVEKYYLTINNMGNCYKRLNNFSKAIEFYQKALNYRVKTDNKFWQGVLYGNLGDTYLKKQDYKNALLFTKNALNINIIQKDTMSILIDEAQIAEALYGSGNFKDALIHAKKAEMISRGIDMVVEKIRLFNLLSEIYDAKGQYDKSLEYLKKENILKQKKYEDELEKKIAAQKLDYNLLNEKQKNENQKQIITLQSKNNNNLKIASIILLLLLLAILYFYQNQKKQNKIIKIQTEQIKEINLALEQKVVERTSELMIVNQQLLTKNEEVENALYLGKKQERDHIAGQLHDNLGGYLSAIRYSMMALDSNNLDDKEKQIFDNIKKMINNAHDEVRHLSHNIMPKDLEEQGIIFCLKKLAKQLNETGKIIFSYTGPKILKIDLKTEYELYSICLELTNNILKHSKATEGGYLIEVLDNKRYIYIYDNGIGLSSETSGFGIENLQKRLRRINAELSLITEIPNMEKKYSTVFNIII